MPRPRLALAMRWIAVTLALLVLAIVPAVAQEPSADERVALQQRIDDYGAATIAMDAEGIMSALPPLVLQAIADSQGATIEQTIAATKEGLLATMEAVDIESFDLDLDSAEFATTADGLRYALIPTEVTMDFGQAGGRVRGTSTTLALFENGTWFLARVGAEQIPLLRQVYPSLAAVEFKPETMERVAE